jgi:hypothetical protein
VTVAKITPDSGNEHAVEHVTVQDLSIIFVVAGFGRGKVKAGSHASSRSGELFGYFFYIKKEAKPSRIYM